MRINIEKRKEARNSKPNDRRPRINVKKLDERSFSQRLEDNERRLKRRLDEILGPLD